jgi:hypothetical protein
MASRKPDGTDSRTSPDRRSDKASDKKPDRGTGARDARDEERRKARDEGRYPDGLVHADSRADTTTPPLGEGGAEGGVPEEKPPEGPPDYGIDLEEQAEKVEDATTAAQNLIKKQQAALGGFAPVYGEGEFLPEAPEAKKGR